MFSVEEIIKLSMEEGSLDIETHNLQVMVVGVCEDYSHAADLDDWSVCFFEVYALALAGSIRIVFVGECPADANSLTVLRYWHYLFECTSFFKTILLSLHCGQPNVFVRLRNGLIVGVGGFIWVIILNAEMKKVAGCR